MFIFMFIYFYIYIFIYLCFYIYIIYIFLFLHIYIFTYFQIYVYIYLFIFSYIYIFDSVTTWFDEVLRLLVVGSGISWFGLVCPAYCGAFATMQRANVVYKLYRDSLQVVGRIWVVYGQHTFSIFVVYGQLVGRMWVERRQRIGCIPMQIGWSECIDATYSIGVLSPNYMQRINSVCRSSMSCRCISIVVRRQKRHFGR